MQRLILIFLVFLPFYSCKKSQEVTPIDKVNLLTNNTSKAWILKDYVQEGKSIIADCAKDDQYTFNAYNKVSYDPKTKCFASDEVNELEYQFSSDMTKITINEVEYKIDEISATKLILNHHNTSSLRQSPNSVLHQSYILVFGAK